MATLIVPDQFSPADDAEILNKAFQGWGTNEKEIIKVLGHRNAAQRKIIREAYQEIYHEDLIKRLESELSGDFEKAIYRWILDPAEREAILANVALKNDIPDYQVIVEVACINSPDELLAVKHAYQWHYKRSLEEDVASKTTGDIRKLLISLLGIYRYHGDEITENLAKSEARILHDAIQAKAFNDEEMFRILSTRSKTQITATINRYRDEHGTSITKSLLGDPADELLAALRTAIRCINDPNKYFAKVLHNAINKKGTNEDALTRVIVTRAEKDLMEIKEYYYKRNSVSLDHAVAKETSGDYEDFLLTLLGNGKY